MDEARTPRAIAATARHAAATPRRRGRCSQPVQIAPHLLGCAIPPGRLGGHGFEADPLEPARDLGQLERAPLEITTACAVPDLFGGLARKGRQAREQEIQHAAQAEDVAARASCFVLPPGLLGGHVGERAAPGRVDVFGPRLPHPGQAEVDQPGLALFVDQDVRRLDIAMNDPRRCAAPKAPASLATSVAAFRGVIGSSRA